MSNSAILKKYLGAYLLLVDDDNWENSINDMPAPVAFEFTKCYIEQMFDAMPDYELADVKNRLNQVKEEMR